MTEGTSQAKVLGEETHGDENIPERGNCRFQGHKQEEVRQVWGAEREPVGLFVMSREYDRIVILKGCDGKLGSWK